MPQMIIRVKRYWILMLVVRLFRLGKCTQVKKRIKYTEYAFTFFFDEPIGMSILAMQYTHGGGAPYS